MSDLGYGRVSWSPDGAEILLTRQDTLWAVSVSTGASRMAPWSPDGSHLVYDPAFGDGTTLDVYVIPSDGGVGMHAWLFRTATFQDRLGVGGAGEKSHDDEIVRRLFERAGAHVMGRWHRERARAGKGRGERKVVRISGGAETIRAYLDAGHIEEFTLHVAPVILGDGLRLLDNLRPNEPKVEQTNSTSSSLVTHVRYRVLR